MNITILQHPRAIGTNPCTSKVVDLADHRAKRTAADESKPHDPLCEQVAPWLLELTRSECLSLLTPAQRAVISKHPEFSNDVWNLVCWNLIREGEELADAR